MSGNWTDRIVGDRMTVDRKFSDRIGQSRFSRQQWGLIMTAVEFEIEHPGDAERARIVADTAKVSSIISELDDIERQMSGARGGGGGSGSGSGRGFGLGEVLSDFRDALGINGTGDSDREQLEAAERLAQEYANSLQTHLEEQGRWDEIRDAARD